jgi:hypothetical protein
MAMIPRRCALLLGCLALAGCERDWERASAENEGSLCFSTPDGALEVSIFADCLSGSCSRDRQGTCEMTRDGDTITITSAFSWEEKDHGSCTLDCVSPHATCRLELPPDGTYTVVHGEETSQITVPDLEPCPL